MKRYWSLDEHKTYLKQPLSMRPGVVILGVFLHDLIHVRELIARVTPVFREGSPVIPDQGWQNKKEVLAGHDG